MALEKTVQLADGNCFVVTLTDAQRSQVLTCIDTQIRFGPGALGGLHVAAESLALADVFLKAKPAASRRVRPKGVGVAADL